MTCLKYSILSFFCDLTKELILYFNIKKKSLTISFIVLDTIIYCINPIY